MNTKQTAVEWLREVSKPCRCGLPRCEEEQQHARYLLALVEAVKTRHLRCEVPESCRCEVCAALAKVEGRDRG